MNKIKEYRTIHSELKLESELNEKIFAPIVKYLELLVNYVSEKEKAEYDNKINKMNEEEKQKAEEERMNKEKEVGEVVSKNTPQPLKELIDQRLNNEDIANKMNKMNVDEQNIMKDSTLIKGAQMINNLFTSMNKPVNANKALTNLASRSLNQPNANKAMGNTRKNQPNATIAMSNTRKNQPNTPI